MEPRTGPGGMAAAPEVAWPLLSKEPGGLLWGLCEWLDEGGESNDVVDVVVVLGRMFSGRKCMFGFLTAVVR